MLAEVWHSEESRIWRRRVTLALALIGVTRGGAGLLFTLKMLLLTAAVCVAPVLVETFTDNNRVGRVLLETARLVGEARYTLPLPRLSCRLRHRPPFPDEESAAPIRQAFRPSAVVSCRLRRHGRADTLGVFAVLAADAAMRLIGGTLYRLRLVQIGRDLLFSPRVHRHGFAVPEAGRSTSAGK